MPTLTLPPLDIRFKPVDDADGAPLLDTDTPVREPGGDIAPLQGGDAQPDPAKLPEDHTADAPPVDHGQDFTPSPYPGDPSPLPPKPLHNDAVAQYIQSLIGGKLDPKLEQAQQEDRVHRAIDAISSGLGAGGQNFGNAISGHAQAFANSIAGKGYTSPLLGQQVSADPGPLKDSAVQRYLQAQQAAQTQAKTGLDNAKAAIDLSKLEDGKDPDSLAARRLELETKEYERKLKQGDRGQDQKDESQQYREKHDAEVGELNWKKYQSTEEYRKEMLRLREKGIDEQSAKDAIKKDYNDIQRQKAGLADESQEQKQGRGVISGWKFQNNLDPKVAREFNDVRAAARLADKSLERMQELVQNGELSRLSPTQQDQALMEVYSHEVLPQINTAQKGGVFANGRARLLQEAMANPNSFKQLMIDAVSNNSTTKIRAFRDILRDSVLERGEAYGGEPLGDPYDGAEPGVINTARPGRPGSQEYNQRSKGTAPAPKIGQSAGDVTGANVTVRRKSDGLTKTLSAKDASRFLADPGFERVQ